MCRDINQKLVELHKLHFTKIVALLTRKCGNAELAKDAAQDAFETLLEKKESLASHPNLAGWLYSAALNKLNNELKRARNRMEVPLSDAELLSGEDLFDRMEYGLPRELSDDERDIIVLRIEEALSYPEIAEKRGISEDAARQQFSRAFKKLKKISEKMSQKVIPEEM